MSRIRSATGLVIAILLLILPPTRTLANPVAGGPYWMATAVDVASGLVGATASTASGATTVAASAAMPLAEVEPATVLARVSATRGLEAKGDVALATLSRDEYEARLRKNLEKEDAQEGIETSKALWVLLDWIGENDDLGELWVGAASEQTAGFYEFSSRSMNLIGRGGALTPMDEMVLAHEYVHALQDQHFDIGARLKQEVDEEGEKGLALRALVEGDATVAMAFYALENFSRETLASVQSASSDAAQSLASIPLALRASMIFPYEQGTSFVVGLFRSGGWPAINGAYDNPPTTSEQIIHPEKYGAGEGARPVELPDITAGLGEDWSLLETDSMGELGWLLYLQNGLNTKQAGEAGAGWGGDRYALLRSETGRLALVVLSEWDTEVDADEFFGALYDLQNARDDTQLTRDEATSFAWNRSSTSGYAGIEGQQVVLVITSDEATTATIVEGFRDQK
ncbi:MAG: hypothetical protein HY675_00540 [Chloroflexi bacterium]|nr:hypothetical protein [Chloroflexota bacterium]